MVASNELGRDRGTPASGRTASLGSSWAIVRTPADLGKFLAKRRVQAGWTQRELADHLGFPPRYLHEIESGKNTLAYTRLFTLLRELDLETRLETASPDEDVVFGNKHFDLRWTAHSSLRDNAIDARPHGTRDDANGDAGGALSGDGAL